MKVDYSKLEFRLDTRCVTFYNCVMYAIQEKEFVFQIDRLFGTIISKLPTRHPLYQMIDKATGFQDAQLKKFVAIVWETIWLRLDPKIKISFPEHEEMLRNKYEPIIKEMFSETN